MAISGIRVEQAAFESASAQPIPVAVPQGVDTASGFTKAMRGLAREIDVGEAAVKRASQLHSYDTVQLIALQAGIYRYTEAVDLASKIVDRASNAVRTVLQGGGH